MMNIFYFFLAGLIGTLKELDDIKRDFKKTGFHALCYIGTMPRLVHIKTWFFGIIHCISVN